MHPCSRYGDSLAAEPACSMHGKRSSLVIPGEQDQAYQLLLLSTSASLFPENRIRLINATALVHLHQSMH